MARPLGVALGAAVPINVHVQGAYDVARPQFGSSWTLRLQIPALFPTF